MCSSPICSEEHLVFYHIFSQFFTNIFEFLNLKTENDEKYRNSISRLLAETEKFPVFRWFSAGKFFPGWESPVCDVVCFFIDLVFLFIFQVVGGVAVEIGIFGICDILL